MKVLIVLAHPERRSYTAALADTARDTLRKAGHTAEISDLYSMKFSPVLGLADFPFRSADDATLNIAHEQTMAFDAGLLAQDIATEQRKLQMADILILQFPMWWFGMPAIMKGWVDRVLTCGFAYQSGRKYDTGMFYKKRGLVAVTTGTAADTYAPNGIDGDIMSVLWPIHNGILHYTGFDVLSPFVAYEPARRTPAERASLLDSYAERIKRLEEEQPLFFHPASDYGPDERLKPGVQARTVAQRNSWALETNLERKNHYRSIPN